ncbi:MAG: hypothetical protein R2867_15395 [Caldilineaceae bacterium]
MHPLRRASTPQPQIASNDSDETLYDFVLQGIAYDAPTITKSVSADPAAAGEPLTYTVVIANDSPLTITNSTISDTLSAGANLVAGSGYPRSRPGQRHWPQRPPRCRYLSVV